jgi:hypothetical protein
VAGLLHDWVASTVALTLDALAYAAVELVAMGLRPVQVA